MIRATLAALGSVAAVLVVLAAPACIIPSISQSSGDAGSAATAAASGGDAGSAAAPAVTGATCTQVTSSVSLCEFISSCPTLSLNPKVFPQCGFRIGGSAIDPECWCQNEYLCPVGRPTTCAEAAQDSSGDVNYDSVCEQALTGGCQDLVTPSTSSGVPSAACQTCVDACANAPSCIEACGC